MSPFLSKAYAFLFLSLFSLVLAQSDNGYIGYELHKRGDPESVIYETADTPGVVLPEEPDVYLNASVSVGEIDITVENITAKLNLDAKVLNLLHFTAGVDASIDRVSLQIQNVSAKVLLEARLGNVVQMIGDVLNVIDLNPIVATLGNSVNSIVGNVTDDLGSTSSTTSLAATSASATNTRRELQDYNMKHNILYSVNNYSGEKHTNRILAQNGSIYDQYLDNDGNEHGRRVVGSYSRDMTFTGHNRSITMNGSTELELGYKYTPFAGLQIMANIYVKPWGQVVNTQIIAEAEGGGTSTISDDADI
ncbi:Uu.00g057490.m01.CDS01 [Anthostomella pinea]|uniref:Uu.00g057490.m01.CDS01 n=1 Tax=Anthostomella pinea TaxID=933095 RepID=A0AAI8VSC6_9PEZI|nr:Uu.00g057490.m01.CDS01 [Anthostomella pinea]